MTILGRAIGAHDALEVGTFLGYGAIAIARGLPDDGHLTCCELDEDYAERAREHVREAGFDQKVEIRVGPALDTLRAMDRTEQFDFAFLDADKTEYIDYFEETLPRMRPNGVILLDNTLRDGTVLDPGDSESARVTAELNDRLAKDDRVEVALLGFADGITMIRKR
jgi:caffeoyl-CoA O-methyltransferase